MNEPLVDLTLYQSLVGGLHHQVITRPDIGYAIGCVSRYPLAPQVSQLIAAKQILRYFKGTTDFGLHFPNTRGTFLVTYIDVDYGRDLDTRRPILRIIHKMGKSSIEWSNKR
jgi:hypothetical protein